MGHYYTVLGQTAEEEHYQDPLTPTVLPKPVASTATWVVVALFGFGAFFALQAKDPYWRGQAATTRRRRRRTARRRRRR